MRIVLDTNIYLAGARVGGFVFELLKDLMNPKQGHTLYISPDINEELNHKLELWKEQGLISAIVIRDLQETIIGMARLVTPTERLKVVKTDPEDNKILECAVAARADVIVSMDKDLLKLKVFHNIPILHPKTFRYLITK